DLIITIDTVIAHLAGALGKPVWVMLNFDSDWRWLTDRTDTPWYPTMRLFRQSKSNDWQGVCQKVADALVSLLITLKVTDNYSDFQPGLSVSTQKLLYSALEKYQAQKFELAEQICHLILQHQPENFSAWEILGQCAKKSGKIDLEITYLKQAINLNPHNHKAHLRLAIALKKQQQFEEAIVHNQTALALQPNFAQAWHNLGELFKTQGKFIEAISSYQKALNIKPNYADVYNSWGNLVKEQGNLVRAKFLYEKAIELNPKHINAHFGKSFILLKQGDLISGFSEYEWRWQHQNSIPRNFSQPLWDGSNFQGQTLLVYTEQGLGYSIQFIRYIPLVKKLGGRIIVECNQATLKLLFSTVSEIDELFVQGKTLPDFDLQIPLMSLPRILGTTLETIPANIPYLSVPKLTHFKILSTPEEKLKVGIFWQTNTTSTSSQKRSCPIQYLQNILNLDKASFYILQKEVSSTDLEWLNSQTKIYNLGLSFNDLADTAAAIKQLDLIITIDTVIAHLAGALGKPVWVMLNFDSDWRWLTDRTDTPWYPTMRLFRQSKSNDWEEVCRKISEALSTLITGEKISPNKIGVATSATVNNNIKKLDPLKNSISEIMKITAIGWPLNPMTGWGIYGINLTLQLLKTPGYQPLLLMPPSLQSGMLNPLHQALLNPTFIAQVNLQNKLQNYQGKNIKISPPILQALTSNFVASSNIRGSQNIGIIFSENTQFTSETINRSQAYDLIITGSTWNTKILQSNGIKSVEKVLQGIDQTIFHPAPKSNIFGDRFVVFSGGKLEYRKGQDIVIAAFKIFQKRHPEALLITAWHNFWPQFMAGIEQTGNVVGLPKISQNKRLQITEWLLANDIPTNAVIDVGPIPNYMVGQILREADVSVFTNRCEGGTNLVAMESLACGIPTIISANTGHLDLINDSHCYALRSQNKVKSTPQFPGVEGWGESDVEEVVEMLEKVYSDQEDAKLRSKVAVSFMQDLTWEKQIQSLLVVVENIILSQ
ncbi:MAG: tetratricopeptide repeat protein, partial [Microcoleaceae cyanobacterium MO_207.B10]|nr:tetratricopeptide repeat protein [Microcoleaceae cyanobacterium MO_207.B10]